MIGTRAISTNRKPVPFWTSVRTRPLWTLIVALLWCGFGSWLIFLYLSERSYGEQYVQTLIRNADLATYVPGDVIRYDQDHDRRVFMFGWSGRENRFRWSGNTKAGFLLKLGPQAPRPYRFEMKVAVSVGAQRVRIAVNGVPVKNTIVNGASVLAADIPARAIKPGEVNAVVLDLPDARLPGDWDPRELGIAFVEVALVPQAP